MVAGGSTTREGTATASGRRFGRNSTGSGGCGSAMGGGGGPTGAAGAATGGGGGGVCGAETRAGAAVLLGGCCSAVGGGGGQTGAVGAATVGVGGGCVDGTGGRSSGRCGGSSTGAAGAATGEESAADSISLAGQDWRAPRAARFTSPSVLGRPCTSPCGGTCRGGRWGLRRRGWPRGGRSAGDPEQLPLGDGHGVLLGADQEAV